MKKDQKRSIITLYSNFYAYFGNQRNKGVFLMEYGTRFKRSLFGGFKRADVLKCFEEMTEEKASEIKELQDKIDALNQELSASQAAVEQITAEKETIVAQKEELSDSLKQTEDQLSEQRTRAEQAEEEGKRALSESKASLQLLKERDVKIAFLEDKSQKLAIKLEASESKSRKYDSLSVEIGEMMLEAKRSAEAIIRQAELRSEQVAAQTDIAVDTLSQDLNLFLQQLNHIKLNLHTLVGSVDNQLQSIETSLSGAQENIRSFKSVKALSGKQPETVTISDQSQRKTEDKPFFRSAAAEHNVP